MSLLWRADDHHRDVQTLEAATWTAEHIGAGPGECPMTRHGMIRPPAVGPRLSAEDPRVFMAITDTEGVTSPVAVIQISALAGNQGGQSTPVLEPADSGRPIPDTSRKSKSP